MTSILANRQTRRRGLTFAILIAITLLLMAFSANPYILEAQRGLSFALRPFQGAIADVADNVSGVVSAIGEIDSLRIDNASLRSENDRLTNENARLQALKRENDELTAALQLQGGFNHKTVATRVIGRDSLDTRQMVTLDKGTDDGIEQGDVVVVQGGAARGAGDRRRAELREGDADQRRHLDGGRVSSSRPARRARSSDRPAGC